jgi:Fe-S oxidoreductase
LAHQPFSRWFRERAAVRGSGHPAEPVTGERQVVFFHDTFTEYHEPHVGQAAIRLLEACAYRPILVEGTACCGRPAFSKGLLDTAQAMAIRNVRRLEPYASRGVPIVGVEPGCISMLTGEYRDLVPGAAAVTVADATSLLEDFLIREGASLPELSPKETHVLYHGHCQQKANYGTEAALALLGRLPGVRLQPVESSCCGMAGSFGYEREHYDLSLKLAELTLAPAVRAAPEQALICASGTSCREQIRHTTGRLTMHPVEVLAAALPRQ